MRVPLASGLLTGKFNKDSSFAPDDHRNYNINGDAFDVGETFSGINFNKALEAVDELKNILPEGITLSQLSLKWILMHDAVSIVIPGAKNKDHVGLNTSSSELDTISSLTDPFPLMLTVNGYVFFLKLAWRVRLELTLIDNGFSDDSIPVHPVNS